MLRRTSSSRPRRSLHSPCLTLLITLATGCSNDATPSASNLTPDAAPTPSSSATADSDTELFGGGSPPPSPNPAVSSSAPDTDGTGVNAPIQACSDAIGGSGSPMLDDFEDGNTATIDDDGRGATWYFYDDMTQGERNDAVDADPLGERSGNVLSVTGTGFSDWGSGFGAGMRWNTGQCTYDASTYDGVEFWIRGAGDTRVTLQNLSVRPVDLGGECPTDAACFDSHGVDLTLSDAWTLVHLPFSAFEQAGWGTPVGPLRTNAIYLLEFQFGTIEPYLVWLDDVKFFRDSDPSDTGSSGVSVGSSAIEESSSGTNRPTDSVATSAASTSSHTLETSGYDTATSEAQSAELSSPLDAGTPDASVDTASAADAASQ